MPSIPSKQPATHADRKLSYKKVFNWDKWHKILQKRTTTTTTIIIKSNSTDLQMVMKGPSTSVKKMKHEYSKNANT
jgi:hypothetical protein